tara:strand:+ start:2911 stop:3180 length:270 start_codon:yes stop_codon:yes gene_type:complete
VLSNNNCFAAIKVAGRFFSYKISVISDKAFTVSKGSCASAMAERPAIVFFLGGCLPDPFVLLTPPTFASSKICFVLALRKSITSPCVLN